MSSFIERQEATKNVRQKQKVTGENGRCPIFSENWERNRKKEKLHTQIFSESLQLSGFLTAFYYWSYEVPVEETSMKEEI